MKNSTEKTLNELLEKNGLTYLAKEVKTAIEETLKRLSVGGKIVVCGNGGSAADSQHIVGELLKGFVLPRRLSAADKEKFSAFGSDGELLARKLQYGVPAISLTGTEAISTAVINDNGAEMVFAQQAYGLLKPDDVFIGISTSGNSENVYLAMLVAKAVGAYSIALTGKGGGKIKGVADVSVVVADDITFRIQEKHLPIYHIYCMCIENELFGD